MGCQLWYGTAGATGGGFSLQTGSLQPYFEDRQDRGNVNWDWQRRAPRTWKDRNQWFSLWSFGCKTTSGDGTSDGAGPLGHDMSGTDMFEPFSCDGEGTQSSRFIKGAVLDANDVAVAGAIVQGFVTATEAFVGQVETNTDGTYVLPTFTAPGVQHYLVAYKAGSPDVTGATVNTLTSTNVDGT